MATCEQRRCSQLEKQEDHGESLGSWGGPTGSGEDIVVSSVRVYGQGENRETIN